MPCALSKASRGVIRRRGTPPARRQGIAEHRQEQGSNRIVKNGDRTPEYWRPNPLVGRPHGERWRARGMRRRDLCRYPEMSEDPLDHGRLFDERDQAQAAAAPRTGQHIKPERPAHQLGPLIRASPGGLCAARVPVFRGCLLANLDSVCGPRNDHRAPQGTRREHAGDW